MKTVRYELLAIPAYLKESKNKKILFPSRSLRTRSAFKNIWLSLDDFDLPYSIP